MAVTHWFEVLEVTVKLLMEMFEAAGPTTAP
jgi:hypothetical protein